MNLVRVFQVCFVAILVAVGFRAGYSIERRELEQLKLDDARALLAAERSNDQRRVQEINRNAQADIQHDADLAALPGRVVTVPVWVRSLPAECASDLQRSAAPPGPDPGGRGIELGSGERNIRPALEQFKVKYETALANCRRLDTECPWAH